MSRIIKFISAFQGRYLVVIINILRKTETKSWVWRGDSVGKVSVPRHEDLNLNPQNSYKSQVLWHVSLI